MSQISLFEKLLKGYQLMVRIIKAPREREGSKALAFCDGVLHHEEHTPHYVSTPWKLRQNKGQCFVPCTHKHPHFYFSNNLTGTIAQGRISPQISICFSKVGNFFFVVVVLLSSKCKLKTSFLILELFYRLVQRATLIIYPVIQKLK